MLSGMFVTKCAGCGKTMYTYAKNKMGELEKVYCSKVCEGKVKYEERMKK